MCYTFQITWQSVTYLLIGNKEGGLKVVGFVGMRLCVCVCAKNLYYVEKSPGEVQKYEVVFI